MKRMILVAIILLSFISVSQSVYALDPGEDTLDVTSKRYFYKDPVVAFRLALFPGFLIHGRGTIYAGRRTEGAILMATEAISVICILFGVLEKSQPETFRKLPGNNDSLAVTESSGRRMITYGAIGFAFTWVVDMVYSPHAAARYNAEHNLRPAFEWQSERMRLGIATKF